MRYSRSGDESGIRVRPNGEMLEGLKCLEGLRSQGVEGSSLFQELVLACGDELKLR